MIRGVNRKVIEVKNCNNAYFERAFLVVKSEKANMSDDLLSRNAALYVTDLNRTERKKRRNHLKAWLFGTLTFLGGAVLALACAWLLF